MSAPSTEVAEKSLRRAILSAGVSFWAVAAIGLLAAATNAAASPLYRLYQLQFRFSATTLTLLFTVYVVVLLVTLLFLGSASDYLGRRPVMVAALALGAVACGLFLAAHGVGLLFVARALQGVAVGLISGTASAALLDLRPASGITPVCPARLRPADRPSGRLAPAPWPNTRQPRPTWFGGCSSRRSSSASSLCWRCQNPEPCAPAS
jgi:hypothetical protein